MTPVTAASETPIQFFDFVTIVNSAPPPDPDEGWSMFFQIHYATLRPSKGFRRHLRRTKAKARRSGERLHQPEPYMRAGRYIDQITYSHTRDLPPGARFSTNA